MKVGLQMRINKLIIQGPQYKRTLSFTTGLNIISGEKTSGKSLVLSLIDFALGKDKINLVVQKELNQYADRIFLECFFSDDVYTIERTLKKDKSKFMVYYCPFENIDEYIPQKMIKSEFQTFIMDNLGAYEYEKVKGIPKSEDLTTETVSFRDLFRFCFVNQQQLGTHAFLSHNEAMKKYKNPIVFEIIFDLVDRGQNEIQSEIAKKSNIINNLERSIAELSGYLKQRGNNDFFKLEEEIDNFDEEILVLQNNRMSILHRQNEIDEANKSNDSYRLVYEEILKIDNYLNKVKKSSSNLHLGIESNSILLNDYMNERKNIEATEQINYVLKIDDQDLMCPLCHTIIEKKSDNSEELNTKKALQSIRKEIDNKIKMVERVINTSQKKIVDNENEIEKITTKKRILQRTLAEFSKEVKTPYLSELNALNVQINKLEQEKSILLESKRVHKKISELEKKIEKNQDLLAALKTRLNNLKNQQLDKKTIIDSISSKYKDNLELMRYNDLSDTYIDENTYIPYYQGSSVYEQESGGLLECMQFSYLESIVSSEYSKHHPQLLMFDTISKYFGTNVIKQKIEDDEKGMINDPQVYLNIFQILENLGNNNQIIVVENTPPEEMLKYEKYSFRSGERGLIDLTENEFVDDQTE